MGKQTSSQMILDNLKTAGVQQAHKDDKITFTSLTAWPGEFICAEGRYLEATERNRETRRDLHRPRVRHRWARRIWSLPPAKPATPVSMC